MAHTRAADDFQAIRASMEELRREREGAAVRKQTADQSSRHGRETTRYSSVFADC